MEELEKILRIHGARYPKMEPADAVKLIYQNEFGGGHLIRDEASALAYLHREYQSVPKDPAAVKRESIGNGIVRVFLAPLSPEELQQLGKDFIHSAKGCQGSLPRFVQKLCVLRRLAREGVFSFSAEELEQYLCRYEQAGYPMVSHSEAYRREYHPAYRIILDRGEKL